MVYSGAQSNVPTWRAQPVILSRRLGLFALLVATGAATPACSSDAHDDAATSDDALIDAPLDTNHKFAVGVCSGPLTGGATENEGLCLQPKTRCTGTLVAPTLVLTAQHCVRKIDYAEGGGFCDGQFGDPVTDAPVRVTLSDSVKVGEPEWLSVKSVLRPYGNNSCADDVVLLLLHQAVPSSVARPVKMALGRSVVANPPKEVAIVGRGVVREVLNLETWEMDQDDGDLYRRIATNIPFVCATNDGAGARWSTTRRRPRTSSHRRPVTSSSATVRPRATRARACSTRPPSRRHRACWA